MSTTTHEPTPADNDSPDLRELRARYEAVGYPGQAYRVAHPDRLWTIARLVGHRAPTPDGARILEIGCGDGAHLLAMATTLPNARLVGADLSSTIMRPALEAAQQLGLDHLATISAGVESLPDTPGGFDYIIAHGVWSWVPESARAAMFSQIKRLLSDRGVAYVSYNTLPGWHLRGMIRDAVRWRTRDIESPTDQLAAAHALIRSMAGELAGRDVSHARAWAMAAEVLERSTDGYFFHDYLSPHNHAVRFESFVRAAESHDLSYLGEARFGDMLTSRTPVQLGGFGDGDDPVVREQLLDYVRGRSFRRTLLVHSHHRRNLHLHPLEAVGSMWVTIDGGPVGGPADPRDGHPTTFATSDDVQIECADPLSKAALLALHDRHPMPISFAELLDEACARSGRATSDPNAAADLACLLTDCFAVELIELHPRPVPVAAQVSAHPRAYDLARYMAQSGVSDVTNLLQQRVTLDAFERLLLAVCDGQRTSSDIAVELAAAAAEGQLQVEVSGQMVDDRELLASIFEATVDQRLEGLRQASLLTDLHR